MPPSTCPDPASLGGLLEERLSAADLDRVQRHVEDCARCAERLDELRRRDVERLPGLDRLREPPPPPEAPLGHVLQKLGQPPESEDATEVAGDALEPIGPEHLAPHLHFEIQEIIGHGGMGVVLKAYDRNTRTVVAIKLLAPKLAADKQARKRFKQEGQTMASLREDPHILPIYAVEETAKGGQFLVMKYVQGRSLEERLAALAPGELLPLLEIVRIARQTAEGLAAAHAKGVVHRDIKPANLLLENGIPKVWITDFGLARVVDTPHLTQSGALLGTPDYMAPEQAKGEEVDARADLFGLGGVLYALCTGRSPFLSRTFAEAIHRVCDEEPVPIVQLNPNTPRWLIDLVASLMRKDPAARGPSAAVVAELLGRKEAELNGTATGREPIVVAPVASAVVEPPRALPSVAQPLRNGRLRFLLLFLALPPLVALVGWGLWPKGPQEPVPQNPPPPPPSATGPRPVVLVVAAKGFTYREYDTVRGELAKAQVPVAVAVASERPDLAVSDDPAAAPVKPDWALPRLTVDDCRAVLFIGGNTESLRDTASGRHAAKLVEDLLKANKPVAAIGSAALTLARFGVLRDRKATGAPEHRDKLEQAGATFVSQRVVADRGVVTARHARDAAELVGALLPGADLRPQTVVPQVLVVVAPDGFWDKEYTPLRKGLEAAGLRVAVGTDGPGSATPNPKAHHAEGGKSVVADLSLAEAKGADYAAVVFVGGNEKHFLGEAPVAVEARRLLTEASAAGRVVATIGSAVRVLATTDLVNGREVAAQRQYHEELRGRGARLDPSPGGDDPDWGVRRDGPLATARSGGDVGAFVQRLKEAIAQP